MLKEVKFKNYKAFEYGSFKIKPITIMLGANSIGKTSLLQFVLMLQQTALANDNYKSALKLHGGFLSLGEGKNIFRKRDLSKPVSIKIDFTDSELESEFAQGLLRDKIGEIYEYARLTDNVKLRFKDKELTHNDEIKYFQKYLSNNKHFKKDFIVNDKIYNSINSILDYSIENTKIIKKQNNGKEFLADYYLYRINNYFRNIEHKKNEINFGLDFINSFSKLITTNSTFSYEFEILSKDKTLLIKCVKFYVNESLIFNIDLEIVKEQIFNFQSPFINKESHGNKINELIKKHFIQPSTIFSFINTDINHGNKNIDNLYFIEIVINILTNSLSSLENHFDEENINYVSPLRANPKRYYFLDKAKINTYLDTLDGDALAETLKENEVIKNQVNDWLNRFGLNVQVDKLEDILHKLTINQNSLNLDITDVGFGISQVLPVIIQGFLSFNNSITLIEQPEIHLHPKMQADLADLFIEIAINKKSNNKIEYKNLVIETHSEYLLRRLRRRISEGVISPDNVAIYLIKRNPCIENDNSIIEELRIEEKGNFEYPVEFYGGELLKDETVFLKNQIS